MMYLFLELYFLSVLYCYRVLRTAVQFPSDPYINPSGHMYGVWSLYHRVPSAVEALRQ